MNIGENMIYWVAGLIVLGIVAQLASNHFAPESRERRRCRRNHRKVVSRARRPVVMLNARVSRR